MDRIPLSPYDFFGYLASGFALLAGLQLLVDFPPLFGGQLQVIEQIALVAAAYVAGHVIATPSKAILEDMLVARVLGSPSKRLFSKQPPVAGLLFPGYCKPLPSNVQSQVRERARKHGVSQVGDPLFFLARFHAAIRSDAGLMRRLDAFLNLYGFARNLAFTLALIAVACVIRGFWPLPPDDLALYALVAGISAVGLLYRYLKFFRHYSVELFCAFASLGETASSDPHPVAPAVTE